MRGAFKISVTRKASGEKTGDESEVLRAQIVRGAAQGQSDKATASALGIRRETVALWRQRVRAQGIGCVWETAAGHGRKRTYAAARVGQWIEAKLQTKPARATHWNSQ